MEFSRYIVWLVAAMFIISLECLTIVSVEAAGKSYVPEKLVRIDGKIIDDFSGNKSGFFTIKSLGKKVVIGYYYGKFKISGAEYFKKGDMVTAFCKPSYLEEMELVSVKVKRRRS